jgi:hypothetical protein
MPRRKQRVASWAACKHAIADWPRPGVVGLVKELYELSDDNRRFLHARLLSNLTDYNVEDARRAVAKRVTPSAVFNGRFRHSDLKRVVDEYEKATRNLAGVASVLVADLDASLQTFRQVGDFEPIVDHAYASMQRLHQALEKLDPDTARPIVEELAKVANRYSGQFGYGVSDELDGLAAEWADRMKAAPPSAPPEESDEF